MKFSIRLIWIFAALVSALSLIVSSSMYRTTAAAKSAAAERLRRIASQAEQLAQLRATLPEWAAATPVRTESSESLAQRVPAAVAAAGLPTAALASLSPESNAGADGTTINKSSLRIDRRKATLSFGALTLPQLGRLLSAWREREPGWVITSIDATPERATQSQAGGDLPVRVVLTVESLAVHRPQAAPSSSSLLPSTIRRETHSGEGGSR